MRKRGHFGTGNAANHAANALGGRYSLSNQEHFASLVRIAELVRWGFGKPLHHLFTAATARVASIAPLCAPYPLSSANLLAWLGFYIAAVASL